MVQRSSKSTRSGTRRRKTRSRKPPPRRAWWLLRFTLLAMLLLFATGAAWTLHLDRQVRAQFEGRRWAVPATVYARPLELYIGLPLTDAQLRTELAQLDYRQAAGAREPGSWDAAGGEYRLATRAFTFWDGEEPARRIRVRLDGGLVVALSDADSGAGLPLVRLDPARIGHIYPAHHEDRLLVQLQDVPPTLVGGLLAMEDANFYQHFGVSVRGIARAAWANLRAGEIVQGGSTLTQQLVKNFFLTEEQTFARKLTEAAMAVLLELRYDKEEILETYINEVYLGVDRERFIHGFGLASEHFFGVPLAQLDLARQALLIALNRGPSYYDPRRHPDRALAGRDQVLQRMAEHGVVDAAQASAAMQQPLGLLPERERPADTFPAFLDLVQRHLQRDYRREDLQSAGLRIFTTLSPTVQAATEQALVQQLHALGEPLQGAAIVADPASGEVLALIGGSDPRFPGFNRALDARRAVGSLIKPFVFLAGLERMPPFTLGSVLDDSAITVATGPGQTWTPQNYDGRFAGPLLLIDALAQSRNVPTVRLGLEVGLAAVQQTLQRLGAAPGGTLYPSLLLGSFESTVLEVAQLYQTLATGGFRTPLRAVRAVTRQDGTPLNRYALTTSRQIDTETAYLLNTALIAAMRDGTGRSAYDVLPQGLVVAGKTGTTDDGRDSWFAGFSADLLAVVWVGRDDNGPTGLSGATGALPAWSRIFAAVAPQPLALRQPAGVEWAWIERGNGRRAGSDCAGAIRLPFLLDTTPPWGSCGTVGR